MNRTKICTAFLRIHVNIFIAPLLAMGAPQYLFYQESATNVALTFKLISLIASRYGLKLMAPPLDLTIKTFFLEVFTVHQVLLSQTSAPLLLLCFKLSHKNKKML